MMSGFVKRCSALLAAFLLAASSMPVVAAKCPLELAGKIPPRGPAALSGSQFIKLVADMQPGEREAAIVAEVLNGNIPGFLRKLAPVEMVGRSGGKEVTAVLCVMPDYLAVGSDRDFVRMPMNLRSGTTIARAFGFILPTDKIVDAVYRQAAHHYTPQPLKPGPWMTSAEYFRTHDRRIREQASQDGAPAGALVAGHKKDVVLSNRLNRRPERIAIYGWHHPDGTPIQPLSTAHDASYADYSHGIRLVSESVSVDRRRYSMYDLLRDQGRADLLNSDGAIRNVDALMGRASMTASAR